MAARIALLALLAVPFGFLALRMNRACLPGALEPVSLAGNAASLLGFLLMGELVARSYRAMVEGRRVSPVRIGSTLLLCGLAVWSLLAGHAPRRDEGPDVLVILLDVLRADHLGCYGYERPTSPNIDRLAADSVLFEDFVAASTYTKTSVATMFTGLEAHHHGVYLGTFGKDPTKVESDVLESRFTTLAEAVYEHGLNTVAWVQNGQVRAFMGYAQGFSLYHDQPGHVDVIANGFMEWQREWAARTRYFAYLHILDLHAPYKPEPPYLGRFGGPESLASDMDDRSWYDFKVAVAKGEVVLSDQELAEFEAKYDEMLVYVDEWVGRIIDDLKATGRYDETLIVLTSDHGEGFWEHGFISHSNLPYEELTNVPLIMKLPKSAGAGRRVPNLVGHVDLAPTLIEFVGGTPPEEMSGESFLPLANDSGAELDPRWRYIEFRGIVGIRTERWKLIVLPSGKSTLYDLEADPGEQDDCIAENPEVAEQLQAAVQRARRIRAESKAADRVVLDQETIESLEALGYL